MTSKVLKKIENIKSSGYNTNNFLYNFLKQTILWIIVYFFGYCQWDIRWVLIGFLIITIVIILWNQWKKKIPKKQLNNLNSIILNPELLPAWFLDPDTQRSEWTNILFGHLWPHLEIYLRQTLTSIESDLQLRERLAGYHVNEVRFPHFSLGQIPPKIEGIKVHKATGRDEIILDINIRYEGDLSIGMEANLSKFLPPATASINNLSLLGQMRLHLRPLLKDAPFIGGVTASFTQAPKIDFDLGGIATSLDLPGISLLLRHIIQDQLEQTIVMPNSVSISFLNEIENTDKFFTNENHLVPMPAGVLSVHIIEAKGLANKDKIALIGRKSDPYVKCRILADGVSHTFKSETINNDLNPVWKLSIDMPVDDPESLDDLHFEIWDEDRATKDDFLGECYVPLKIIRMAISNGQNQDIWKPLEPGFFHVSISWSELKISRPNINDDFNKGVLVMVIDSCSNLLSGKTGLKLPNPVVQVDLCGVSQTTDVVVGNVNPVYCHRMNFLVRDPESDIIRIMILDDKRRSEKIGQLRLNISDLLEKSSLTMTNQRFSLSPRSQQGEKCPEIVISMSLRYIYRPNSISYGVHSSLEELNRIMQTRSSQNIIEKNIDHSKISNGEAFGKFAEDRDSIPFIDNVQGDINLDLMKNEVIDKVAESRNNSNHKLSDNNNNNKSITNGTKPITRIPSSFLLDDSKANTLPKPRSPTDLRPKIYLSLKYSQKTMTLSVVVHKARNLSEVRKDNYLSHYPYVKIYLIEPVGIHSNRRLSKSKRKTSVQKSRSNPIFEETLEYFMLPNELKSRRLEVSVWGRKGLLGRAYTLGRCLVSLNGIFIAVDNRKQEEATITDWHVLYPEEKDLDSNYASLTRSLKRVPQSDRLSRKKTVVVRRSESSSSFRF